MIVKAYKTNCCGLLKEKDEVHGLISIPDIFDVYNSFKTVDADKSDVHYCTSCYTARVTDVVDKTVKRKNNEEKYREKIKEYAYVFKKSLFIGNSLIP